MFYTDQDRILYHGKRPIIYSSSLTFCAKRIRKNIQTSWICVGSMGNRQLIESFVNYNVKLAQHTMIILHEESIRAPRFNATSLPAANSRSSRKLVTSSRDNRRYSLIYETTTELTIDKTFRGFIAQPLHWQAS